MTATYGGVIQFVGGGSASTSGSSTAKTYNPVYSATQTVGAGQGGPGSGTLSGGVGGVVVLEYVG